MSAEPTWSGFLGTVLDRWQGSGAGGETPSWIPPATLEKIAGSPHSHHGSFLSLMRQRVATIPVRWIDATWIRRHLPSDPLLRRWALCSLPNRIRRDLAAEMRRPAVAGPAQAHVGGPPFWFSDWWLQELGRQLHYPVQLPWNHDRKQPLSYLWRLEGEEIVTFLELFGLRSFAAIFAALEPGEAARLAYAVPVELRDRLVDHVKSDAPRDGDGWRRVYAELGARGCPRHQLPVFFALKDLAANASPRRRTGDAERLAYRLPFELGNALLEDLHADLSHLAAADGDAWESSMRRDAEELLAQDQIRYPEVHLH